MGLCGIRDVTLAEARELVDAARQLVKAGENPILDNWQVADTTTFKVFAEACAKNFSPRPLRTASVLVLGVGKGACPQEVKRC